MFLRALLAFVALPGAVAFLMPLLVLDLSTSLPTFNAAGIPFLGVGLIGLLWCVWAFYVTGKGTLAPWAPPRHLVTIGLYGFSRNPMYVAVLLVLLGWAVSFSSAELGWYAAVVAIAFHLRVVFGEEPWLARTHGASWLSYRQAVPRWLGRSPPSEHPRE